MTNPFSKNPTSYPKIALHLHLLYKVVPISPPPHITMYSLACFMLLEKIYLMTLEIFILIAAKKQQQFLMRSNFST